MGGRGKKRKLVLPTNSIARGTPSLPTQYDFSQPAKSTSPEKVPNQPNAPTVRDYPPPQRLFQTPPVTSSGGNPLALQANSHQASPQSRSAGAARTDPVHQASPHSRPAAAARTDPVQTPSAPRSHSVEQPSGGRVRSSPRSSHAQNHTEEEEEVSDAVGPDDHEVEPTLSDDVLEALNRLLSLPRRKQNLTVLDPDLAPGTTW